MSTMAAGAAALATSAVVARGPILAATDGTRQSDGALAVANALAGAMSTCVQVIAVQRPVAIAVVEAPLVFDPEITTRLTAQLKARARVQCADISSESSGPVLPEPVTFNGEPERIIACVAEEQGAQLIVVGIGRHDVVDRIFGSETALKVARLSHVPVLAVPARTRVAPRRIVVGVDFSDASLQAAQSALHLLTAGGVIDLVHVVSRERLVLDPRISDREYAELVRHRFTRLRAMLDVPPNVIIEHHTHTGDTAKELIAYAEREHADLIAAGSHGHGFVSRLVLGSFTTALLRGAKSAVLVVPPDFTPLGSLAGGGAIHVEPPQWTTLLADFTRTNTGRRTRLEIDDPEIGAQAQEMNYPLLGVAMDPHDQRLEIMLGVLGTGEPHLSRSINDVSSVDLLVGKDGKDAALRVGHGKGQTMLTFVS